MHKLHFDILPKNQLNIFNNLSQQDWIKDFYLAGGTALALQIGHRRSIDFDFFTPNDFNLEMIKERLGEIGLFIPHYSQKNTLVGEINKVQLSFFKYKYKITTSFITFKKIKISSKLDIALMKLDAISGRGSKKDFIDLFFLLNEFKLIELITRLPDKFGEKNNIAYQVLRSLVYFEDAEDQLMPEMIKKVNWKKIKNKMEVEVKKIDLRTLYNKK